MGFDIVEAGEGVMVWARDGRATKKLKARWQRSNSGDMREKLTGEDPRLLSREALEPECSSIQRSSGL